MRNLLILLTGLSLFAGCSARLAQRCAEQFPCRDSVIILDKFIEKEVEVGPLWVSVTDSVECPPDTLFRLVPFTKVVEVPVTKVLVKYQYRDTCHVRVDDAKVRTLQDQLTKMSKDKLNLEKKTARLKTWRTVSWLLLALVIGMVGYIVTKALKK